MHIFDSKRCWQAEGGFNLVREGSPFTPQFRKNTSLFRGYA